MISIIGFALATVIIAIVLMNQTKPAKKPVPIRVRRDEYR